MSTKLLATVLKCTQCFAIIGGGLLCLWGLIALGTAIKDHNGPGIQQAIWQLVGGALIIVAGGLFGSIIGLAKREAQERVMPDGNMVTEDEVIEVEAIDTSADEGELL